MDLTSLDENGEPWNFTKDKMRKQALNRVNTFQPTFVIGSPGCTI